MAITVYFTTESKRENSTKQLTMPISHSCTFKNGCSMLNPTLFLEIETEQFPAYTAFKIENRYYRVTDIRTVRNNLFEIDGIVDTLATYKADILASTQYVSYSSHKTSIWLADTRIPLQKNETVSQYVTTMNFLFNDAGFYVMSCVGKTAADIWILDKTGMKNLLDKVTDWSDDLLNDIMNGNYPWTQSRQVMYDFSTPEAAIGSIGRMNALTGLAGNAYSDAPSCIRSCIWVPFFASWFTDGTDEIYLGQFPTGVNTFKCKADAAKRTVSLNIPWQHSDWRRATCEEVYLYLPMVGLVNIPSDEIINESTLSIEWSATATDGCIAFLVKAGNQVVGTFGANCAVNYPIGISQQASAGEIVQSVFGGAQKTISSGIRTAHAKAGSAAKALGKFNIAASAISGAYDVVDTALTRHNSCIGGIGGGAGVGLSLDAKCFTVAHPTVIAPDTMQQTMGLPTMQPMSLATLTGYCECSNAHVDCAATDTEQAVLDNYLNSGFFIE